MGAVLLAVVLLGVWPESPSSYRSTVESSVQDAVSAVGTARLTAQSALSGNTFGAYESTALEDVGDNLTTAVTDVIELPPTDQDTRRLRDEVLPPLQDSARIVGDLDLAIQNDDRDAINACVAGLTAVGDRLATTLERLR
ncbi:hypothetical protein ADL03_24280 [Nocardia sp. NRRL S-836]|nr:hypothetical protein ADL03_24280 [Nocardia sp. NRRL S-836]